MSAPYPLVPLGEVLTQDTQYIEAAEPRPYPKLSVKLYGKGVVPDGMADGAVLKMQRHQLARTGQVILSEIWGKKGAIGLVPPEGEGALCTSHFFLFDIDTSRLNLDWLQAVFTANYLEEQLGSEAKGTTGYAAVRPKHLLAAQIPLPPLAEQRRIVARIEALAGKIAEAQRLRAEAIADSRRILLAEYLRIATLAPRKPLATVAPLVRRAVDVYLDKRYDELGIRSFGKGTFHKAPVSGADLGTKRIFRIEPGDLLFNIVFAWEGAVAVAQPDDAGRVGSHRFLTHVPRPGVATSVFLGFHFLTEEGLASLGAASPGGAGRNRTLGLKAAAEMPVPVPPYELQLAFDRLYARIAAVNAVQAETAAELGALLPAVLARAFRGEL